MTTKLRQVSKEEFEVLTRFHPGEVRYYVDIASSVTRNKGAKIRVNRTAKSAASKKNSAANFHKGEQNRPVQLTTTPVDYRPDTISCKIQRLVRVHLESDPTKVVGRSELVKSITDSSIYRKEQINPLVSDLLIRGGLRYTGEGSAHA